jgi:hypothetical protein
MTDSRHQSEKKEKHRIFNNDNEEGVIAAGLRESISQREHQDICPSHPNKKVFYEKSFFLIKGKLIVDYLYTHTLS